jgi:hypothetical protein
MGQGGHMTEQAKKAGRPEVDISPEQVQAGASIGLTLKQIAAVGGVSYSTIKRRMKLKAFQEAFDTGTELEHATLKKAIYNRIAAGSDKALIFACVNRMGWSPTPRQTEQPQATTFVLQVPQRPASFEEFESQFRPTVTTTGNAE